MNMKEMTAGILAGGLSRRMGTDKSFLEHGDMTMLTHLITECSAFKEIILSTAKIEPYKALGCKIALDELEQFGPMEGIYQILRHSTTDVVFIMATDMPEITASFMEEMIQAYQGESCMVVRAGGRIHPLCGIYHRSLLPELKRLRKEGLGKMQLFVKSIPATYYDLSDDDVVTNVNTPQEYQTWKKEHKK